MQRRARRFKLVNPKIPPEHDCEYEEEDEEEDLRNNAILLEDIENLTPLALIASQGVFFQFEHAEMINWMIVLGGEDFA